jgi:3'-phosphoadenosine 5'-phosphosulfate sulfotransferase
MVKKYVPDVAKSAQHPHSGLKTQKEYKAITDSDEYKKGDYKKKVEMLGGKTWTAQEMETKIKNKKPKSYSWNKTRILKAKGGRIGLKKGKGTGGQEPWWKNREKTKIYKAEGGSVRIARKGGGRAYGKNS